MVCARRHDRALARLAAVRSDERRRTLENAAVKRSYGCRSPPPYGPAVLTPFTPRRHRLPACQHGPHDSTTTATTTQRRQRRAPPIGRCGVMVHDVIIAMLRMRTAGCPRGTRSQRPGLERENSQRGGSRQRSDGGRRTAVTRARTRSAIHSSQTRGPLYTRENPANELAL